MKGKSTIELRNLTTGYRTRKGVKTVVRDISATVSPGELTCLLGPNGAGKSTLLKTLSAFLHPVAGVIIVNGRPLGSYSVSELSQLIGVVLTERMSLNNMPVKELVAMGRSPYTGFWGRISSADRSIIDSAMERVGITSLKDRLIGTLSDGERQKVMIAKALAQETPVIFLDEPTAYLDYPSKVEIMKLLHQLSHEEGKTIFMSTHDLELALQIADKAWLIDKTKGVVTGTPEDLALSGELARYFTRPGIEFDMESGIFKVTGATYRTIGLNGSGPEAAMLKKALLRHGIETTKDPSLDVTVEIENGNYIIGDTSCDDIEHALNVIKALLGD